MEVYPSIHYNILIFQNFYHIHAKIDNLCMFSCLRKSSKTHSLHTLKI